MNCRLVGYVLLGVFALVLPVFTADAKVSPQMLEVLKQQAAERKVFYTEQSGSKQEQRERHTKERQDLITRHREERAEFGKSKHTVTERKEFYTRQRTEMSDLNERHRVEQKKLLGDLNKKRAEFHQKQLEQKKAARAAK